MGLGRFLALGAAVVAAKALAEAVEEQKRPKPKHSLIQENDDPAWMRKLKDVAYRASPEGIQEAVKRRVAAEEAEFAAAKTMNDIYQILKLGEGDIRILLLEPGDYKDPIRLQMMVRDPTSSEYEALSYTWGDETKLVPAKMFGVDCDLTENLDLALRHLRPRTGEARKLWVDALCIDQKSDPEKDKHIPQMGRIYNFARRVLYWLGPSNDESEKAMEYFSTLDDGCPGLDTLERSYETHPNVWLNFVDNLLTREWWGRAWIVQEVVMACDGIFVCGFDQMREDLFYLVASYALERNIAFSKPPASNAERRNRLAVRMLIAAKHGKRTQTLKDDLCAWITNFHGWDCRDEVDHVYAFMGMVPSCTITPKHELKMPGPEVYAETALEIMRQRQTLDFICLGQGSHRHKDIPASWIPDLHIPWGTNPALPPLAFTQKSKYNASRGSIFDAERVLGNELPLTGVRVAEIKLMTNVHGEDEAGIQDSMLLAWGRLGSLKRNQPYSKYPQHTNEVALVRTLSWDLNYDRERCRNSKPGDTFVEREPYTPIPSDFRPELGALRRREAFEMAMTIAISHYRARRRFAILDGGYMAMVPPNAEVGDMVCVLRGATVPMVLRSISSIDFRFIGECYVHGIMDGEAWPTGGGKYCFYLC